MRIGARRIRPWFLGRYDIWHIYTYLTYPWISISIIQYHSIIFNISISATSYPFHPYLSIPSFFVWQNQWDQRPGAQWPQALKLFSSSRRAAKMVNDVAVDMAIRACESQGKLELVLELLQELQVSWIKWDKVRMLNNNYYTHLCCVFCFLEVGDGGYCLATLYIYCIYIHYIHIHIVYIYM